MNSFKKVISLVLCLAVMAVYMPVLGVSASSSASDGIVAFDSVGNYESVADAVKAGWTNAGFSDGDGYSKIQLDSNGAPQIYQHTAGTGGQVSSTGEHYVYTFPYGAVSSDSANDTKILTNKYKGTFRLDFKVNANLVKHSGNIPYINLLPRGAKTVTSNIRVNAGNSGINMLNHSSVASNTLVNAGGNTSNTVSGSSNINNGSDHQISILFDLNENKMYAAYDSAATKTSYVLAGDTQAQNQGATLSYIDNFKLIGMQRFEVASYLTFKSIKVTVFDPALTSAETEMMAKLPENLDSYFASGETRGAVATSFDLPSISDVTWEGDGTTTSVSSGKVILNKVKGSSVSAKVYANFKVGSIDYKKEYSFTLAPGKNLVTFYDNDGTLYKTQDVDDGGNASNISAPTVDNFDFDGWYEKDSEGAFAASSFDFSTAINNDVDLYAKYSPSKYTVTFYADGNYVGELKAAYGEPVTGTIPAIPAVSGKTAVEWRLRGTTTKFDETTVVTSSLAVDAYYVMGTVAKHTVTFKANGTVYDTAVVIDGFTVSKPATDPIKDHYTFEGWKLGLDEYDFSSKVTSDITLEASFKPSEVTVKFYDSDKTSLLYESKGTYGEPFTDFPSVFINADYLLSDIWKTVDTDAEFKSGDILSDDVSVYVVYKDTRYVMVDEDYTTDANSIISDRMYMSTGLSTKTYWDKGIKTETINSTPYTDLATQNSSWDASFGKTFEGIVESDDANNTYITTDTFSGIYLFDVTADTYLKEFDYNSVPGYTGNKTAPYALFYSGYYSQKAPTAAGSNLILLWRMYDTSVTPLNASSISYNTLKTSSGTASGSQSTSGHGKDTVFHLCLNTFEGTVQTWVNDDFSKYVKGPWFTLGATKFNGIFFAMPQRADVGSFFNLKKVKLTRIYADESEAWLGAQAVMASLPKTLSQDAGGNYVLPEVNGVAWSSTVGSVISDKGVVTPTYQDTEVELLASYSSGGVNMVKHYVITVPKIDVTSEVLVDADFTKGDSAAFWSADDSDVASLNFTSKGVEIVKNTDSDSLKTSILNPAYYAYFDLYGKDSADSNTATFVKEHAGVYDIEFSANGEISSNVPVKIDLGYRNGEKFYSAANVTINSSTSLVNCVNDASLTNSYAIGSGMKTFAKITLRVDTVNRKIMLFADGKLLNSTKLVFRNSFGGNSYKMFNSLRVTVDQNNGKGDKLTIKNAKVTKYVTAEISGMSALLSAAANLGMSAVTDSPASLTGALKTLPTTIDGKTVSWDSTSDQIDIQTGKVYRSENDAEVSVVANITDGECTVRKEFYVTIPKTTDSSELAEYELSKLGKVTAQPYSAVTYDLKLPQSSGVKWTSSNTDIISNDGLLNESALLTSDTVVTMTASKNGEKIEVPLTVSKRAPMKTFFTANSLDASGVLKMVKNGVTNLKISGNSTVSFKYTKGSTYGTLNLKDSSGKTALGIKFASDGISLIYTGAPSTVYNKDSATITVNLLPSVGKAAVSIDGTMVADYVTLSADISDFAYLEATEAALPVSGIKVSAEGYTYLLANTDNIDYYSDLSRDYLVSSISPSSVSVTGDNVEWVSSNENVIKPDGTLAAVKVPQFVNYGIKITDSANSAIFVENMRSVYVGPSSRNLFKGASATINSVETFGTERDKAVDGDINTYFAVNGIATSARYITLDLSAEKTFNSVYLNADGIGSYTISTSANGSAWTDVAKDSFASGSKSSFVTLGSDVTTRYIRFTFDKSTAVASVYEIEGYINGTEAELAAIDLAAITLSTTNPTSDITLPTVGANGTKFTWTSSDTSVITNDGKVTVPASATTVTLTVSAEGITETRTFELTVGATSSNGPSVVGGTGGGTGGGAGAGTPSAGAGTIIGDVQPGTTFKGDETSSSENTNYASTGYKDVSSDAWYAKAVKKLTEKGIVSGDGTGNFNPTSTVTREQFVKMLLLAFGADLQDVDNTFADVDASAWYAPYVLTASKLGIVKGVNDSAFGIGDSILRQDMAVLIARVLETLGVELDTKSVAFTDDKEISNYAYDAVYAVKNLGIINGYDGAFSPKSVLTRAEAAQVISALIDYIESLGADAE